MGRRKRRTALSAVDERIRRTGNEGLQQAIKRYYCAACSAAINLGHRYPQVLGLQPKFARLCLHGGTFALDIPQVSVVGRVLGGRKFPEEQAQTACLKCSNSPSGKRPFTAVMPTRAAISRGLAHLSETSFIDFVEQFLLVHRQVIERQAVRSPRGGLRDPAPGASPAAPQTSLEIVDQKVVDGRGTDQFERRLRIAVAPFEVDLFVFGQQPRKSLECLVTFIAGIFDIPRRPPAHGCVPKPW